MRARMFVSVVTLLAAMLPLATGASTTSGDLALSPAHGAPGSHFMATFTFTEAPCNAFAVYFYWDVPNPGLSLGGADATGAGPTCQVSMELVVPSTDAVPHHSYPVLASAQTKQVNTGNGSAAMGSTKDSGTSQFEVTSPPSQGSPGSAPTPSAPSHGSTTASTPAPTGSTSGATGPSSGTGAAPMSSGAPGTSPSPGAADGSSSSTDNSKAPPLAIQPPHGPATGGIGGTILAAGAAFLALLLAAAWTYRTGRLRTPLRR
jgi:hypothetical protein